MSNSDHHNNVQLIHKLSTSNTKICRSNYHLHVCRQYSCLYNNKIEQETNTKNGNEKNTLKSTKVIRQHE